MLGKIGKAQNAGLPHFYAQVRPRRIPYTGDSEGRMRVKSYNHKINLEACNSDDVAFTVVRIYTRT